MCEKKKDTIVGVEASGSVILRMAHYADIKESKSLLVDSRQLLCGLCGMEGALPAPSSCVPAASQHPSAKASFCSR